MIRDNKYTLKKFPFPKIYTTTKSSLNTCHNYLQFRKSYYSSMVSLLKESSTGAYKVYYCFILLNLKKYCAKKIQNLACPKISTYGKSEHFRRQFHKISKTLEQFVHNLPWNCLSVFGHFVGLALKGLKLAIREHLYSHNNHIF